MLQNPARLNREEWLPPQTHHIPVISNPDSRFLISKGSLYGEMELAKRRDSEAALSSTIRSSPPHSDTPSRLLSAAWRSPVRLGHHEMHDMVAA